MDRFPEKLYLFNFRAENLQGRKVRSVTCYLFFLAYHRRKYFARIQLKPAEAIAGGRSWLLMLTIRL